MISLNHTQKAVLLVSFCSFSLASIFWIVFDILHNATKSSAAFFIIAGVALVAGQSLFALKVGGASARKVIFEGRMRKRLKKLHGKSRIRIRRDRQIHDNLMEGVIIIDNEYRIQFANKAARTILPCAHNTKDMSIAVLIREPEFHELLEQAFEQRKIVEKNITVAGIEQRRLMVKASPMRNGDLMIMFFDTTRTSAVDDIHRDFLAHASHELKTPLSVILANAELLVDCLRLDTKNQGLVHAIYRQAMRAKTLLDSLLELVRIDAGHYPLSCDPINIHDFIEDIRASVGHVGLMLENRVDKTIMLNINRSLLERITFILIENAQKYAGAQGTLAIKTRCSDHKITLLFSDNGPGIKPHLHERVFERFFRQPEHEHSNHTGFGLGLSQARAIAHAMNATICVDDSVTNGCTISILFQHHALVPS